MPLYANFFLQKENHSVNLRYVSSAFSFLLSMLQSHYLFELDIVKEIKSYELYIIRLINSMYISGNK